MQYPSDMLEGSRVLEGRLWAALEEVSGQPHIARGEEGGGVECVLELQGVPQLEGRSFQHLLVPQLVKLGGCNLRSLVEIRFPAFIGGLEQALHFMVVGDKQEEVVSPILREAVGGMAGQQRWVEFLAADSRTAREFREAWTSLSEEAAATWAYLELEPSGPLSAAMEEVGGSSVDGSTRSRIVQQREAMRHQLLTRALARHGRPGRLQSTRTSPTTSALEVGSWQFPART